VIGLDRLMNIKGVVAAGQFTDDGKVIRKAGAINDRLMEETARLCAYQNQKLAELTGFFEMKSKMKWQPLIGWAVWGGKYVVVVMGNTGVFIESKHADLKELMVDLLETEPTGPRQMNY
jgi:roadblock/LC7 domain-containing protein